MASYLSGVTSTLSRVVFSKEPGNFAFSIGDKLTYEEHETIWSIHQGQKKDDGTQVSIFIFDLTKSKEKSVIAKNAFKKMRTILHPDVLKVHGVAENENGLYVATEKVVPLSAHLRDKKDENLIAWGLFRMAKAISFLNKDCQFVHGNVNRSAIYATTAGEWRLSGFEILSKLDDPDAPILRYSSLLPNNIRFQPPEVKGQSYDVIKRNNISCTDAWGFGCLIWEIFSGNLATESDLKNIQNIPNSMKKAFLLLVETNPSLRGNTQKFIEEASAPGGYFLTDFVKVNLFLEEMNVKEEREKEEFYRRLQDVVQNFPPNFCKHKILPELLKATEFGAGGTKALGSIVKLGSQLSQEEFDEIVSSSVIRLFSIQDRAIRLSLLENLSSFITRLDQSIVSEKIYPQVVSGFADGSPLLRDQTVKSMILLAPKLSPRIINDDLLRYLAKAQVDPEPGIRTNTIICLGKIAEFLGESTRRKVLCQAFCRSLRDPFPAAKASCLMALSATCKMHSTEDCAVRIIPSVSPLLIENSKDIRTQALRTLDIYKKRLEQDMKSMPDEVPTAVPNKPNTPNEESNTPEKANNNSSVTNAFGDWTSWAVTSLTKKISSSVDSSQITNSSSIIPGQGPGPAASVTTSTIPDTTTTAPSAAPTEWDKQGWGDEPADLTQTFKVQPQVENISSNDGWDNEDNDTDGWGESAAQGRGSNTQDTESKREDRKAKMLESRQRRKKKLGATRIG